MKGSGANKSSVRPQYHKIKLTLIYGSDSNVTTRSDPEKTAMKWTTELNSERITMIEGICMAKINGKIGLC